jgi:uncharacterized protein (DUF2384 family)
MATAEGYEVMDATAFDAEDINNCIVEALAEVRRCDPKQVYSEMAAHDGDLEITAKEAMPVVAIVEEKLGCGELLSPTDFGTDTTGVPAQSGRRRTSNNGCMDPAESTSVKKILRLILNKIGLTRASQPERGS